MNRSASNILNLPDAEAYYCVVQGYIAGHSQMFLHVYQPPLKTGNAFCLLFETVLYFEGPISWRGADFRIGTLDEHRETLNQLRRGGLDVPDQMVNAFLEKFRLFTVENPNLRVRIFAEKVYRTTDVPRLLYEPPETPIEIIDITPSSPSL